MKKKLYILVMIDRFTKVVELAATYTKTMREAAHKFEKRILDRWGTPQSILADGAFTEEFQQLCIDNGIALDHSLPHQHNTVGLVERMNRTIQTMLRSYVNAEGNDWEKFLSSIQFAINSGKASSHGLSPFKLITTEEPVQSIERILSTPSREATDANRDEVGRNVGHIPHGDNPSPPTEVADSEEREEEISFDEDINDTPEARLQGKEKEKQASITAVANKMKTAQTSMADKFTKKNNTGKYVVGDWVSIKNNTRANKEQGRHSNWIVRFAGIEGAEIEVHQNEIAPWPGRGV